MGCTDIPTPDLLPDMPQAPKHIPVGAATPYSYQAYDKTRYPTVCSGSVPDISGSLLWVCTGLILNMVRRALSVSNNQPRPICI